MAIQVINLEPGEQPGDDAFWMLVEADGSGAFLATGAGQTPDGKNAYYSERGDDLESVVEAARRWCSVRNIARICVQRSAV